MNARPLPRRAAARYRVVHETEYRYSSTVSVSRQAMHLAPRACARQRTLDHRLTIDPLPTYRQEGVDCFGNPLTRIEIDHPHRALLVVAESDVTITARGDLRDPADSPAWESVAEHHAYRAGRAPDAAALQACRFRADSPFVRAGTELIDFAHPYFAPGTPLLVAVHRLMHAIHRQFRFDTEATQIATPLLEVLAQRRGVCQDFAHLMIGCLRALGLPARYVSGYLLTAPPPGQPRLVGADASHAWVSVHCPRNGWVDFDPTNDVLPDLGHVTIAWGRDFGDVSPLRGVILGGGAHELDVRVTVLPLG
ncbi:MAG TPA: transglutaminase family protein [Dokdonella sp.]|uniref:transglutaminase family protein n=1 Tax=Dokdonella sp. TaxID=2291710 RepID=UPI002C67AB22|nr:transglutaminase family protein [Dokdonella sp.]HUD41450.1 transglutaminase family protein [Dokdonella sp.]